MEKIEKKNKENKERQWLVQYKRIKSGEVDKIEVDFGRSSDLINLTISIRKGYDTYWKFINLLL